MFSKIFGFYVRLNSTVSRSWLRSFHGFLLSIGEVSFCDMMVTILWFPPPSKASWYTARESAESGGTIHLEKYKGYISCSRSMEVDILESKKDIYLVPEVWRPICCKSKEDLYLVPEVWRSIFWKVKRIYILFQKYGGRYVAKVKRIYILFQMYGGQYFGK